MKRNYEKPAMLAVRLQQMQMLCQSKVSGITGNAGLGFGGSSNNDQSGQGGPAARVKEQNIWDEEW